MLVRKHGVDVVFTQMFNSRSLVNNKHCLEILDFSFDSKTLSPAFNQLDRPLIAQIAGNDPETLVKAGKILETQRISAIDLNLGCPQYIAKRGRYGAYLLTEPKVIESCLTSMVTQLKVPITAKIRKLPKDEDTMELVKMIEGCGISMLTIHGRTRESKSQLTGSADWNIIRKIKQAISIPVVANGGIGSYADANLCLQETGVDGVMSSEALLENPKLFSGPEIDLKYQNDYLITQFSTIDELLDLAMSYTPADGPPILPPSSDPYPYPYPYPLPSRVISQIRGHLFKITHRMLRAPPHRHLQKQLAQCGELVDIRSFMHSLRERYQAVDINMDSNKAIEMGLLCPSPKSWYHRFRCDPASSLEDKSEEH